MSFLTRTSIRNATRATFAPRAFSTSFAAQKTTTESAKDTLKTVDRKVSDKLVDGIEVGQTVAAKAKDVAGLNAAEAKGKASEVAGQAKGKAAELKGEAKGKAEEVKGKL